MILIKQPLYQMGGITVIFICKQRNPRHCVFSFNLPDDDKFIANLPLLSSLLVRRCTNQNKRDGMRNGFTIYYILIPTK